MLLNNISAYKIILASASPRRQELLSSLGLKFEVVAGYSSDEIYPEDIPVSGIPLFLAKQKSTDFPRVLQSGEIVITADTIVALGDEVLHKPASYEDAFHALSLLSSRSHFVYTGVCIRSVEKEASFVSATEVRFGELSPEEIHHYIEQFKPFDKAGSYGIQEWIGFVAVEEIHGSYFNVMGLPVHRLYRELEKFIAEVE